MTQEFQVSVFYPAGGELNMDYYVSSHLPLVERLLSAHQMTELSFVRPVEDDPEAAFQLIATLRFASREAGLAGLAAHGPETQADIPNFTDVTPMIVTGDVRVVPA
jgi:uncharacterized protein (TIGR02118 family)